MTLGINKKLWEDHQALQFTAAKLALRVKELEKPGQKEKVLLARIAKLESSLYEEKAKYQAAKCVVQAVKWTLLLDRGESRNSAHKSRKALYKGLRETSQYRREIETRRGLVEKRRFSEELQRIDRESWEMASMSQLEEQEDFYG